MLGSGECVLWWHKQLSKTSCQTDKTSLIQAHLSCKTIIRNKTTTLRRIKFLAVWFSHWLKSSKIPSPAVEYRTHKRQSKTTSVKIWFQGRIIHLNDKIWKHKLKWTSSKLIKCRKTWISIKACWKVALRTSNRVQSLSNRNLRLRLTIFRYQVRLKHVQSKVVLFQCRQLSK